MKLALVGAVWASAAALSAEDIVVTATKEPVDPLLLSLPVEVTLPGDALSLGQVLSSVPGLDLQETSPANTTLRAPTFGENGFGRLNFLIDGISQNNPDMARVSPNLVPVAAVDHVETLLGPASALYGDQSVAGAVNVVTKVPTRTTYAVATSVTSTLTNTQSAFWGTPLGAGGLLLAFQRDAELPTRQHSASTEWNVWSKLLVPVGADRFTVTASAVSGSSQMPGTLTEAEFLANPDAVHAANARDSAEATTSALSAQWDSTGPNLRFTVPASVSARVGSADTASWTTYTRNNLYHAELEPRVQGTVSGVLGGDLTLGAGLGGAYQRLELRRYNDEAMTALNVLANLQRARADGWLTAEQNWSDTVVATAVVRSELSTTTAQSDQDPAINNARTFVPVAASAGVAWIPAEGTQLAVHAGRTFRYPFLDEMVSYYNFGPSPDSFNTQMEPETGLEAGASARMRWGVLELATQGSVLRMDNEVLSDPVTGANKNMAASLHASSLTALTAALPQLPGSLGSARLTADYAYEAAWFVEGVYSGKTLPLVPAHTVRTSAQWTPWEGWTLGGAARFVSGFVQGGDFTNSSPLVASRAVYDASVAYRWVAGAAWSVQVFAKNLSDDRTPDFVYYSGWYPSEGRRFGAEVKASY